MVKIISRRAGRPDAPKIKHGSSQAGPGTRILSLAEQKAPGLPRHPDFVISPVPRTPPLKPTNKSRKSRKPSKGKGRVTVEDV
jgi:hypothetical protein